MTGYPADWTAAQKKRFDVYLPYLGTQRLISTVPCIHVAGTNGKGSVCAMLESMLRCAGYKTGLFTSPHLYEQTERICIHGVPIDDARMQRGMARIRRILPKAGYFEQTFFCAMEAFEEDGCEIAVIEAGIGGAMDVTNLVQPLVTVVANIGLDHTAVLGDTLWDIARQKAGIAKHSVPMVLYPGLPGQVQTAVKQHCQAVGAPVYGADTVRCEVLDGSFSPAMRFFTQAGGVGPLRLPLLGMHQQKNAQTALCAAASLPAPFSVDVRHMAQGLSQTHWPGRMQWISGCSGGAQTLVDGAHNPQAAQQLKENIQSVFAGMDVVLLCAVMQDKNAEEIAQQLGAFASRAVCTVAEPGRGMPADRLAALFSCPAEAEPDPKLAFAKAKRLATERQAVLVVAGSLYLPGAIGLEKSREDA